MRGKVTNKLSPEQHAQFADKVAFWQSKLNLCDWRIEPSSIEAEDAMACITIDNAQRLAVYCLGDFKSTEVNEQSISMTALHEVLHIFLHDLVDAARDRGSTDEELEAQTHRVINVLERLLYREIYGKTSSHR